MTELEKQLLDAAKEAFEAGSDGDWQSARKALSAAIAAAEAAEPVVLEPVEGDLLPAIGEEVLIHLASSDKWVPHRVVGYYAWGDRGGNKSLHRVFVRVVDRDGYQNARLLCDVRRTGEGRTQQPASAQQVTVPDGYVLVPLEPTSKILGAICHAKNQTASGYKATMTDTELASIYRAMLSAAQKQEGGE